MKDNSLKLHHPPSHPACKTTLHTLVLRFKAHMFTSEDNISYISGQVITFYHWKTLLPRLARKHEWGQMLRQVSG